jgi:hypothetical protein
MFEGKLPQPGLSQASASVREGLRAVTWSDLVARLDAARDLRNSLRAHDGDGEASFDRGSARHIAAISDGKRGVNLDDLVDGKAVDRINGAIEASAAGDDPRE